MTDYKETRKIGNAGVLHEKFLKSGKVEGLVRKTKGVETMKAQDGHEKLTWKFFRRYFLQMNSDEEAATRAWMRCTDELGNRLQKVKVNGEKALLMPLANSESILKRRGSELVKEERGKMRRTDALEDSSDSDEYSSEDDDAESEKSGESHDKASRSPTTYYPSNDSVSNRDGLSGSEGDVVSDDDRVHVPGVQQREGKEHRRCVRNVSRVSPGSVKVELRSMTSSRRLSDVDASGRLQSSPLSERPKKRTASRLRWEDQGDKETGESSKRRRTSSLETSVESMKDEITATPNTFDESIQMWDTVKTMRQIFDTLKSQAQVESRLEEFVLFLKMSSRKQRY